MNPCLAAALQHCSMSMVDDWTDGYAVASASLLAPFLYSYLTVACVVIIKLYLDRLKARCEVHLF
jgi:hypothetical protein